MSTSKIYTTAGNTSIVAGDLNVGGALNTNSLDVTTNLNITGNLDVDGTTNVDGLTSSEDIIIATGKKLQLPDGSSGLRFFFQGDQGGGGSFEFGSTASGGSQLNVDEAWTITTESRSSYTRMRGTNFGAFSHLWGRVSLRWTARNASGDDTDPMVIDANLPKGTFNSHEDQAFPIAGLKGNAPFVGAQPYAFVEAGTNIFRLYWGRPDSSVADNGADPQILKQDLPDTSGFISFTYYLQENSVP